MLRSHLFEFERDIHYVTKASVILKTENKTERRKSAW